MINPQTDDAQQTDGRNLGGRGQNHAEFGGRQGLRQPGGTNEELVRATKSSVVPRQSPLSTAQSPITSLFPLSPARPPKDYTSQNLPSSPPRCTAYNPQDAPRPLPTALKARSRRGGRPGRRRAAHLGAPGALQHLLGEGDHVSPAGGHLLREQPLHGLAESRLRVGRPGRHRLSWRKPPRAMASRRGQKSRKAEVEAEASFLQPWERKEGARCALVSVHFKFV